MFDIEPKTLMRGLMIVGIGVWGGLARFLAKDQGKGKKGWAFVLALTSTSVISGFASIVTLPLSKALHLGDAWAVFLGGMAGYMGVSFLAIAEQQIKRKFDHVDKRS